MGILAASLATILAASAQRAAAQDASQAPAAAAPAPPPAAISFDQPVAGSLDDRDALAEDSRRFDAYRMTLDEGAVVQIDLASEEFDTVLELRRAGASDVLAENDDYGQGLNSRLIFRAPAAGDYEIRALAFSQGSGRYALTVRRLAAAGAAVALTPGGSTNGAIGPESAILPGGDSSGATFRYRPYSFQGRAGQRVRIDMRSPEIDSRLQLIEAANSNAMGDDDSGGGQPNARIIAVLPRDGTYLVNAIAPSQQAGSYTLDLAVADAPASGPEPQALSRGRQTSATFGIGSPALLQSQGAQISYFYAYYTLPVRAGETLTVHMRTTDFRPFLDAGAITPVGYGTVPWVPGRGTGPGTITRIANRDRFSLILRPDQNGTVILRARSSGAAIGNFTLEVVGGAPAP